MTAYSVILTLFWCCREMSNASPSSAPCSQAQKFADSVKFEQCKTRAWLKLSERPPAYIESLYSKGGDDEASHPFCDYLYELETECLPLYSSSCYPARVRQVIEGSWIRRELEQSLTVFPRDQYFKCNSTSNLIHSKELAAMKKMIRERDWVANSRYCRYLQSYSVQAAPNYWLYSVVRCDGSCDPGDILEIPFRVSPTINNPPREYRKRVRVIDFKDPGYLNPAMNDSLVEYEACLDRLGYPHHIQDKVRGEAGHLNQEAQRDPELVQAEVERLKSRSCSVITTYVEECQKVLSRCLTSTNQEMVRAKDATWLVSQLSSVFTEYGVDFELGECEVLGGKVSSSEKRLVSLTVLSLTLSNLFC